MNYSDCLNQITALIGLGMHRGLDRIQEAAEKLQNPHLQFPTIHIAGSNGKGSTVAMTAEILKRAGYQTGATYSPHVMDYRERIQINGEWISKEDLISLHSYLKQTAGSIPLTYFEWTILLAFLYFAKKKVDIAILETGMGGRWDATNIAHPILGAITNVSLEHEEILGPDLEKILIEKMQIFKSGMMAWTGITDLSLMKILEAYCDSKKILLHQLATHFRENSDETFSIFNYSHLKCGLKGRHQNKNAAMAVALTHSLKQQGYSIPDEAIREGILKVTWPGRLEVLKSKPEVLLDGAHNRAGIEALASYLRGKDKKYHLVFGTLKNRPFEEMIRPLLPLSLSVHWALFDDPRGFTKEELKKIVVGAVRLPCRSSTKAGEPPLLCINQKNWNDFQKSIPSNESILVTGSLYLVSEVRKIMTTQIDGGNTL